MKYHFFNELEFYHRYKIKHDLIISLCFSHTNAYAFGTIMGLRFGADLGKTFAAAATTVKCLRPFITKEKQTLKKKFRYTNTYELNIDMFAKKKNIG